MREAGRNMFPVFFRHLMSMSYLIVHYNIYPLYKVFHNFSSPFLSLIYVFSFFLFLFSKVFPHSPAYVVVSMQYSLYLKCDVPALYVVYTVPINRASGVSLRPTSNSDGMREKVYIVWGGVRNIFGISGCHFCIFACHLIQNFKIKVFIKRALCVRCVYTVAAEPGVFAQLI